MNATDYQRFNSQFDENNRLEEYPNPNGSTPLVDIKVRTGNQNQEWRGRSPKNLSKGDSSPKQSRGQRLQRLKQKLK